MISQYGYKTIIINIEDLMKKIEEYINLEEKELNNYTIVTVGQGGKTAANNIFKDNKERINIKWSRDWQKDNSNKFITDIENFCFKSKKIILVEDVIATGETIFNIVSEIEKRGGDVQKIICGIINDGSPLLFHSFKPTIVAVKTKSIDAKDPFWYPAIYSTRHLFFGDSEMPDFYNTLKEKYFEDDKIEKTIKNLRGE